MGGERGMLFGPGKAILASDNGGGMHRLLDLSRVYSRWPSLDDA